MSPLRESPLRLKKSPPREQEEEAQASSSKKRVSFDEAKIEKDHQEGEERRKSAMKEPNHRPGQSSMKGSPVKGGGKSKGKWRNPKGRGKGPWKGKKGKESSEGSDAAEALLAKRRVEMN